MGVEVILHHHDDFCFRIGVHQTPHGVCVLNFGTLIGDPDITFPSQGQGVPEQVRCSCALIFVVHFFNPSGLGLYGHEHIGNQLSGSFVKTDYRTPFVVRPGVHVQHVFQRTDEGGVLLRRKAPLCF
jgi:hypothetical protein